MVSRRSPSQRENRVARQLAALSAGSGRGRLATPRPMRPVPPPTPAPNRLSEQTFSKAGPQDTTPSGPWPIDVATRILGARFACTTPGSTDSVLTVYLDGVSVGSLTLPAGEVYAEIRFDPTDADTGQFITVALTTVGTGLDTVTATVLLG